jgi:hypothetical protein
MPASRELLKDRAMIVFPWVDEAIITEPSDSATSISLQFSCCYLLTYREFYNKIAWWMEA